MRSKKEATTSKSTGSFEAMAIVSQSNVIYQKEPVKSSISRVAIQEILGWLLIALNWPNVEAADRDTMLRYVDGLERCLIDMRDGGLK